MVRPQLSFESEVGASYFPSVCEVGQAGFCLVLVVSVAEGLGLLTKGCLTYLHVLELGSEQISVKIQFGHHLKGTGMGPGSLREMYRRNILAGSGEACILT